MEKRITFKTKREYYLELLMFQTMNFLGRTKGMITKDETTTTVPHLETTVILLIHCNIVNKIYQQGLRVSYTFIPNKSLGQSRIHLFLISHLVNY